MKEDKDGLIPVSDPDNPIEPIGPSYSPGHSPHSDGIVIENYGIENDENDGIENDGIVIENTAAEILQQEASPPEDVVVEVHDPRDSTQVTHRESRASVRSAGSTSTSIGIAKLEGGGRFDAYSTVTLTWQDVAVNAPVAAGGCFSKPAPDAPKTVDILKGVSGIVEPGQFMAIMGASGAGKTTLLNTLAFRNEAKLNTSGNICVNGLPISKASLKLISAYVQQEDYFIGTLTVEEVMMFHANLRMDKRIPHAKKEEKVKAILNKLGLTRVKDSLCGYPGGLVRGISGGERKRLSVATELLMDPPLMFIDEPTSGLDSFMAESIVKLIRKLALANRTVLCTIHQPTSEVFALFDRVCLVAEGEIAFMGKSADALEHFGDAGCPCPANYNPADHYIFTLAIRPGQEEACKKKCQELTGYYKRSEHHKTVVEQIDHINKTADKSTKAVSRGKIQSSWWRQVSENFNRSFLNTIRNPGYTRSRIGQCIIFALLAGLAYLNTKNDISTVAQDKTGVLFFLVISFTFGNVFIQTQTIPFELPVVKREYQNGMYTSLPYFMSKIITELPYLIALPLLQMAICYFMIGLRKSVAAFFTCVFCCIGVSWASTGLGWFIAASTGDARIAAAISAPIIMPFFLFGGLFQNGVSTPIYFEPIKYISWFRYGFNMMMVNEFKDLELDCPSSMSPCPNGTSVLIQFGINPEELFWPNMAILCIFGITLCVFAWGCLLCKVRR